MTGERREGGWLAKFGADGRLAGFASDDRGVSVTVNYALNLVVAMLLIGGVLTATGGMVEDRRDSAARTELSVLGERIAADLMAADRLAVVGTEGPSADPTVAVEVSLPDRVAGSGYEVTVDPTSSEIVLRADKVDVTVRVGFHHETPVAETTVRGGDLRIVFDAGSDRLEVAEA